jgi:hypothetical protein
MDGMGSERGHLSVPKGLFHLPCLLVVIIILCRVRIRNHKETLETSGLARTGFLCYSDIGPSEVGLDWNSQKAASQKAAFFPISDFRPYFPKIGESFHLPVRCSLENVRGELALSLSGCFRA